MTEEEVKGYLLQWVKDYCNDEFIDGVPAGVMLFIEQAYKKLNTAGRQSESLGDARFSYMSTDDYNKLVNQYLYPYRRIKML